LLGKFYIAIKIESGNNKNLIYRGKYFLNAVVFEKTLPFKRLKVLISSFLILAHVIKPYCSENLSL
jgi:hypothetical protein